MISVTEALVQIVEAILWVSEFVLQVPGVKADAMVTVLPDDGYLTDEYTERRMWQEEIAQGLRSPVEYRVRFYGESEADAIEAIKKMREQYPTIRQLIEQRDDI